MRPLLSKKFRSEKYGCLVDANTADAEITLGEKTDSNSNNLMEKKRHGDYTATRHSLKPMMLIKTRKFDIVKLEVPNIGGCMAKNGVFCMYRILKMQARDKGHYQACLINKR